VIFEIPTFSASFFSLQCYIIYIFPKCSHHIHKFISNPVQVVYIQYNEDGQNSNFHQLPLENSVLTNKMTSTLRQHVNQSNLEML